MYRKRLEVQIAKCCQLSISVMEYGVMLTFCFMLFCFTFFYTGHLNIAFITLNFFPNVFKGKSKICAL